MLDKNLRLALIDERTKRGIIKRFQIMSSALPPKLKKEFWQWMRDTPSATASGEDGEKSMFSKPDYASVHKQFTAITNKWFNHLEMVGKTRHGAYLDPQPNRNFDRRNGKRENRFNKGKRTFRESNRDRADDR